MWNQPQILAALIPLAGVLLSMLLSWLIASLTTKTEIRKAQLQLFKSYAERLQERRLVVYPTAFCILSDCGKRLRRQTLTWDDLAETLAKLQAWDSENSLIFSRRCANVVFEGQWQLDDLVNRRSENLNLMDFREKLLTGLESMELVLKEDIGVFAVEYEDRRQINRYDT